jgi:hypothetical protein
MVLKVKVIFTFSHLSTYLEFLKDFHKKRHSFELPSLCFILLLSGLCGGQVVLNMKTYLHCMYCKVKTRIHEEKCHTL